MASTPHNQQHTEPEHKGTGDPKGDPKHPLAQPPGPSPQPNPESAPGGDKVGGEMPTAPFTGAPLKGDKPAPHK